MANEALYYGTGRRKNAVARVRLVPGTGKVTVNGRDGKEYFGREALLDYAKTPFKVTDTLDHFDVLARIDGGGISGQAGALRHGISRALLAAGDYRAELKKAGFLTRDARMVERKKYGLKKARKRPQFSKRYGLFPLAAPRAAVQAWKARSAKAGRAFRIAGGDFEPRCGVGLRRRRSWSWARMSGHADGAFAVAAPSVFCAAKGHCLPMRSAIADAKAAGAFAPSVTKRSMC